MLPNKQLLTTTRTRLKTRELARHCGWLDAMLCDQDRIVDLVDALDDSRDALSWARHWATLDHAIRLHFHVEHAVLAPAIQEMGLRAHVVIAEMCRTRILRDLEDLRMPSWEDDGLRIHRLGGDVASHFAQQESCSYRALARQQDERAGAELSRRCLATLADSRPGGSVRFPSTPSNRN